MNDTVQSIGVNAHIDSAEAPVEKPVAETQQTEAAPVAKPEESATQEAEKAAAEGEKDKPESKTEKTFTQQELDEILQKRLAKEQRKFEKQAKLQVENEVLKLRLSNQQAPAQEAKTSAEPKAEDFKTYEDFISALTDYRVEQRMQANEQKTHEARQKQAQQEYEAKIASNLLQGVDKYDDYEEVVYSIPAQYVTAAMTDAIGDSEIAADIAYYLGEHHEEAARIAKMPPVAQVKAIDRLEAQLKAPKKISTAPPPLETTGKGKGKPGINLETADFATYLAERAKTARWARR